jgi:hypothetical protein
MQAFVHQASSSGGFETEAIGDITGYSNQDLFGTALAITDTQLIVGAYGAKKVISPYWLQR